MKKIYLIISISVLITSTILSQSFSGRVSDFRTLEFLSGVTVDISNLSSGETESLLTDNTGSWSYTITSLHNSKIITSFELSNNYPNPFNPSTTFSFSLPEAGNISIVIHDVLGRIIDRKDYFAQQGSYKIDYDGIGSAGVYFYTLNFDGKSTTKKMIQLDGGKGSGLVNFRSSNITNSNLNKATSTDIQVVYSKFGYVIDTLFASVSEGDFFETTLETLHSNSVVVDLHNDILERIFMQDPNYNLGDYNFKFETDIPRLQIGGVDLQFFAVWVSPTAYAGSYYTTSIDMINHLKYETFINSDNLSNDNSYLSAINSIDDGKISGVIGVEGGHSIEKSI